MASYLTSIVLEFAEEDLSDTTPTWVDVTADLIEAEWWAGVAKEGNDPDAGGARLVLRNRNRRWEPDYVAGQFYPNITTHRRFRLTLDDSAGSPVQEGVWYVADIALEYPGDGEVSLATFTCSDGVEVLALDNLPLMDPPDADSYADVVSYDEPWGYWRLGEPEGTMAVARIRRDRRTGRFVKRKRHLLPGKKWVTRAEVGGVAGPSGVYKNNPGLGHRGMVLGDSDTSVEFTDKNGSAQHARVPLDSDQFADRNAVTAECWMRAINSTNTRAFLAGPYNTTASANTFALRVLITSGLAQLRLALTSGIVTVTSTTDVLDERHVVGTWDGAWARIYINGVLEAETGASGDLRAGNANEYVYIGAGDSPVAIGNVFIDEAAVFEYALSPERILAHYRAGAERGYPEQTAGARIADIAAHALWDEANIQTTGRNVMPAFKAGQAKLGEIGELAHAEGPRTMFWFDGDGDPVYFGHEWKASSASFNTVQAVFGDGAGEIRPQTIEGPMLDNEVYNETTVTHEAGEAVTVGDGTPAPRRENTEYTDVLLHEHVHVESLAYDLAAFYQDPQWRPLSVTLNGANPSCLHHILRRDIGHLIRVKRRGEGGTPIDRVANIIAKRKHLSSDRHLTCVWTLSRGFNAAPATGGWHAGIAGFSEAGSTTVAA